MSRIYACVFIGMRPHSCASGISILENKGLQSCAGESFLSPASFFLRAIRAFLAGSVDQFLDVHGPAMVAIDQRLAQQLGIVGNARGRGETQHAL